jgi:hypothetical protein
VTFAVVAQRLSPHEFRVAGEMPVRMTQFGVVPPHAMFGMIRAADRLTVRFDLFLEVRP